MTKKQMIDWLVELYTKMNKDNSWYGVVYKTSEEKIEAIKKTFSAMNKSELNEEMSQYMC